VYKNSTYYMLLRAIAATGFALALGGNGERSELRLGPRADYIDALVAEAIHSNPEIAGARSHWQVTTRVPRQMGTLDDPQVFVQEFTIGSPAPASGYETSDFYACFSRMVHPHAA